MRFDADMAVRARTVQAGGRNPKEKTLIRKILVLMAVVAASVGLLVSNLVVAQATPSASRSFSAASVAPGGDVVVTITVAGHGNFVDVKETLPAGFTYVSSSLSDDEVGVDGQSVTFLER
jgi:hypothetical protein